MLGLPLLDKIGRSIQRWQIQNLESVILFYFIFIFYSMFGVQEACLFRIYTVIGPTKEPKTSSQQRNTHIYCTTFDPLVIVILLFIYVSIFTFFHSSIYFKFEVQINLSQEKLRS